MYATYARGHNIARTNAYFQGLTKGAITGFKDDRLHAFLQGMLGFYYSFILVFFLLSSFWCTICDLFKDKDCIHMKSFGDNSRYSK